MQNFRFIGAMVNEFSLFQEEEEEEDGQFVKTRFTCISYLVGYFHPLFFLHAFTFSHVLHLDVIRSQIE